MLLTIVDTKSYGRFVLHLYPYQPLNPPKQDVTPLQLTQSLMSAFQYFGIYKKSDIITTSNGNLKENTVVQLLVANQKYTQLVMGLDQSCVLVAKSAFLNPSRNLFNHIDYPVHHVELGEFISMNDAENSLVNSISLVYRQDTYQKLQQVKHKLAFLVSAIQLKQKHSKYLTKQIISIIQQRNQFKKILKDKCAIYLKENNTIYEQFKIKMIYKQIQAQAALIIKKISLFQLLEKIYNCWQNKQFFKSTTFQDQFLLSMNGCQLSIPSISELKVLTKNLQTKTILTVPPKLNSLPCTFYPSQRISLIYQHLLINNSKPLKSLLLSQFQSNTESIYHTISFLLDNKLAVGVYPFDSQRYYNLYTIRNLPDKKQITKFNSLFQATDLMQYINRYQKYYRVKNLDQKVKYLILNKIIKQVFVYIEKLEPVNYRQPFAKGFTSAIRPSQKTDRSNENRNFQSYRPEKTERSTQRASINKSSEIQAILNRHVAKPQEINFILGKCKEKNIKMAELINYVKHNSSFWKFIFVENPQN